MKWSITVLYNKQGIRFKEGKNPIIVGDLCLDNGDAQMFDDLKLVLDMKFASVKGIWAHGLLIVGVEKIATSRGDRLLYQEWFCRPAEVSPSLKGE